MIILETGMCLTQRNSIIVIICIILMMLFGALGYGFYRYNNKEWKTCFILFIIYLVMGTSIVNFGEKVEYKIVTFEDDANITEELQGYKVLSHNEKKNTWRIIWEK